ncbi:MAG: efflux transporter, family, subunit [Bacteroidetes bacterium]|jgi:membrane fusion protein (multidrug efflux system)|nr:efflux transporter, family, subunit [Bacteroidota bacterium]
MKKIPAWIVIVLVIAILIAVKFLFFPKKEHGPVTAGKGKGGKQSPPIAVNYVVAQTSEISNQVYTTGKTGALNDIEIKPEVSGKVTAVYFKEGETVNKGAPIIKINDADLQAQFQKNKIQLKLAEEKLSRLKKLLDIKGISQEEYDIQNNELESLKADQAFLQAQLAKTNITAPFSGVVGLKNISEGAYVSPAQVIATLVQLKPLFIEFSIPEKYAAVMKKGLNITFSSEHESSKTYTAQIYALEPKIDETTKTLRGRALYNGGDVLYPGSFVKVYIDLGKTSPSIMIPSQSVIPVLKGQKVFVSRNGIATEVKVMTGIRTEDKIQILEGLSVGDTVLTTGLMAVKKDSKLKLIHTGK